MLTFFSVAGLWLSLEAEFLALTLVLLYVGAIMVLFLFIVMILDVEQAALRARWVAYWGLGAGLALGIFGVLYHAFQTMPVLPMGAQISFSMKNLGILLYTQYLYPLEGVAVLLLVAMIAAMSITFRGKSAHNRTPNLLSQWKVKKEDRLYLRTDL
jgi:NADH-quinone oxidoreductase subunit J